MKSKNLLIIKPGEMMQVMNLNKSQTYRLAEAIRKKYTLKKIGFISVEQFCLYTNEKSEKISEILDENDRSKRKAKKISKKSQIKN